MDEAAERLGALEERINYRFDDRALLERSLTHPSYVQQHGEQHAHNQRLEFLGDAVLSLILAEKLFELLPQTREGILTRNRSALAKGRQLALMARELDLPAHLRLSEAEERNSGRERDSILEDAFEALIGAVYLDSGMERTREVVLAWYGDLRERLKETLMAHNPKGRLQELVQPTHGNEAIEYRIVDESGPPHERTFHAEVLIEGTTQGNGTGTTKKEAEENAARNALLEWEA